jgi:outer membrane protein TolC
VASASHDVVKSVRATLLPTVQATDQFQRWNCPGAISLVRLPEGLRCRSDLENSPPPMPDLSAFTPAQQQQLESLINGFAAIPVVVRDRTTNIFAVTIDQPLLGLWRRSVEVATARAAASAADAGVLVTQADVAQGVRSYFLQLFEARAEEQIAAASVRELDEQVASAKTRFAAQVITESDLLRVEVAAANARQDQISARADADVRKAELLDAIGLPPSADVEFVEPTALLADSQPLAPDVGTVTERAIARRPEVARAKSEHEAAEHLTTVRRLALLPDIDAQLGYIRTDGTIASIHNQEYIGVSASWTVWDWGARTHLADAAARVANAAALELGERQRRVAVEVQTTLVQTNAARAAVAVAKQTIGSAEEAYHAMQARVTAGTATTTDLLDAQTALTRARLNLARARYLEAVRHVAYLRAIGE